MIAVGFVESLDEADAEDDGAFEAGTSVIVNFT
jgi:hypothetical protein